MNLEWRLTASINVYMILKGGKSWNDKLIKLRYRKVPHYGRVNFMEQLLIDHNLLKRLSAETTLRSSRIRSP